MSKSRSPIERLVGLIKVAEDGCWIWGNERSNAKYGRLAVNGSLEYAHRFSYEFYVGPIPEGLQIDHLCRVPRCVNPDHLEPVTPRENSMRGIGIAATNAAKTHCIHGHPLSGDNLYVNSRGDRQCRACYRRNQRRIYWQRKNGMSR